MKSVNVTWFIFATAVILSRLSKGHLHSIFVASHYTVLKIPFSLLSSNFSDYFSVFLSNGRVPTILPTCVGSQDLAHWHTHHPTNAHFLQMGYHLNA